MLVLVIWTVTTLSHSVFFLWQRSQSCHTRFDSCYIALYPNLYRPITKIRDLLPIRPKGVWAVPATQLRCLIRYLNIPE